MRIAFHITFFFIEERIRYLEKVISGLQEIDADKQIYVYSNDRRALKFKTENTHVLLFPYSSKGTHRRSRLLTGLQLFKYIHPYYLTWECRDIIKKSVQEFDAQVYLEDDIAFRQENLDYWLSNKDSVQIHGYNLGFLRKELNDKGDWFITDLMNQPQKKVLLEGQTYIINDVNPYYGFWIYDQNTLIDFIDSQEFRFRFRQYYIREKSAIGYHGMEMNYFKGTVLPLRTTSDKKLMVPDSSGVHHLPNNYIGDETFCKLPFPLTMSAEHR